MIGQIPKEWDTIYLKDIATLITKGATPTTYGFPWVEHGIFLFKSDCVKNGKFRYGEYNYISEEAHNYLKRSKINSGDIVMSITGDLGRVAIIPEDIEEANINQHLAKISIENQKVHPKFIYHWLNRKEIRRYYNLIKTGLAYPQISLKQVRETVVPVPAIEEQKKIADILSTWDKAIELKEQLVDQRKEQKRGLIQKLLTSEVRLPGFHGDWKEFKIKELSKVVTGNTPSTKNKEYYEGGHYPWITPTDISDSKYVTKGERYLTQKGLEKGRYVPKGSLLVTCIASIGKNAIIRNDGSCNQQINAVFPSEHHSNEFLYYKLEKDTKRLESFAGRSATAIINKKTFENFKVKLPPYDEQVAIAEILSKIDENIELLLQNIDQLKKQKNGLVQLLLTGKIRVKV